MHRPGHLVSKASSCLGKHGKTMLESLASRSFHPSVSIAWCNRRCGLMFGLPRWKKKGAPADRFHIPSMLMFEKHNSAWHFEVGRRNSPETRGKRSQTRVSQGNPEPISALTFPGRFRSNLVLSGSMLTTTGFEPTYHWAFTLSTASGLLHKPRL